MPWQLSSSRSTSARLMTAALLGAYAAAFGRHFEVQARKRKLHSAPQDGYSGQSQDFEADRRTLLGLIQRFTDYPTTADFAANPVFGPLSRRGWGRQAWRHIDHHLRQFGV